MYALFLSVSIFIFIFINRTEKLKERNRKKQVFVCSLIIISKFLLAYIEIYIVLLLRYEIDGTIEQRQGSGRPTKLSMELLRTVETQMRKDDETTVVQLHKLLVSLGHEVSLMTILNSQRLLGWTLRGSAYCQLIHQPNKGKCLAWATENVECEFEVKMSFRQMKLLFKWSITGNFVMGKGGAANL